MQAALQITPHGGGAIGGWPAAAGGWRASPGLGGGLEQLLYQVGFLCIWFCQCGCRFRAVDLPLLLAGAPVR